jgi:hypothetical protein
MTVPDRSGQQHEQPTPTPDEQLTATLARWAANPYRANIVITGDRLLRILRLLSGPARHLTELRTKAEQAAKEAAWSSAHELESRRRVARDAQQALDDAYSATLRDADVVFTALTGIPADCAEALDVKVSYSQLAADASTLLGRTPPTHQPQAWDDEDNKPAIPKIPGPRGPRTTAEDRYTFASAVADCPVHRARHEAFEAQRAEDGESFPRVQRRTLGMPFRRSAVTA